MSDFVGAGFVGAALIGAALIGAAFVGAAFTTARFTSTVFASSGFAARGRAGDGFAGNGLEAGGLAVLALVFAEDFAAGLRASAPGFAASRAGLALRAAFFLLLAIGGQYTPEFRVYSG